MATFCNNPWERQLRGGVFDPLLFGLPSDCDHYEKGDSQGILLCILKPEQSFIKPAQFPLRRGRGNTLRPPLLTDLGSCTALET